MPRLYITIKSFEYYHIKNSIMFIKKIKLLLNSGKKTKQNLNQVSLPKNRTLFTVLRSPHIDKKSREQFQFIHYKKKLFIEIENINKSALFIFFLKSSQFPGVEMEISLSYNSCLNLLKTKKNCNLTVNS